MGTWNTSVTGNDTAKDLYIEYTAAFYKFDVEEALKRIDSYIRTEMFDESDEEEWCNYIYSLADFMWKKGILADSVKKKAIDRGTITEEQAEVMSEKEIIDLLFLPSFSTAKTVSDVSGRGVGLDVVKSKIEALSGEIEVKSKLGEGSSWIIRLPLTLAIIQALMVDVGGEKYAISLGNIQTIEDIHPSEIKSVQSKEVINLRGNVIPLIRLNEVLDIESKKSPEDNLVVVIVKKGDKLAGLVIDELLGQLEIVIKSLGKYINKCKIISGATILGDGEIALILDANALI